MTAEPKPRPLSLVEQHPEPVSQAETLLRQWDPESQLVGALMHLPSARVAPILELVPDTVVWRPDNRWAYEIIRRLVGTGVVPDPVAVLHTARRRRPTDAARPSEPASAVRHHQFAVHLADLYTHAVNPAAVAQYAQEVLEEGYRRAVGLHGARMAELAKSGAAQRELTDCLTAMRAELADLWRRVQAAAS
jgi:replicative DNA helicase